MKKISICVFLLLFMCGCGKSFSAEALSEKYTAAQEIYCEAQIHTSYGLDFDYTVGYEFSSLGENVVLLAPDSIKGISVSLKDGKTSFEDTQLIIPLPDGFNPCTAVSDAIDLLKNGIPSSWSAEYIDNTEAFVLNYEEENSDIRIWVAEESFRLLRAEFYDHGKQIISFNVNVFSMA